MTTPPATTPASPTLLEAELLGRIRSHGPLPVGAFMARALYDPLMGYYARGHNFTDPTQPFGRDFTTAPLLTPLFGTTLADWVFAQWQRLGSPTPFTLCEAGPGNAFLLRDVLTALAANHPTCSTAAQLHLVETSATLTALQRQTLASYPCQWFTSLAELTASLPDARIAQGDGKESASPAHPAERSDDRWCKAGQPLILLANELLDAFPTAVYRRINSQWQQQVVKLIEPNTLTLDWRHPRHNHTPPLPLQADGTPWQPAAADATLETSPAQTAWLHHLQTLLAKTQGVALLLDYGYLTLPPTGADTLQAIHLHQKVAVLHRPGETDLTTHVNFAHVQGLLGQSHCTLSDLAPFLLRHSFPRHATTAMAASADASHRESIEAAALRLLHPNQMGSLFKVLEYLP